MTDEDRKKIMAQFEGQVIALTNSMNLSEAWVIFVGNTGMVGHVTSSEHAAMVVFQGLTQMLNQDPEFARAYMGLVTGGQVIAHVPPAPTKH